METSDQKGLKLTLAEQKSKCNQKRQEKEESILKKPKDLLSHNEEMTFEEKEVLRKTEEKEAKQLKKIGYHKRYIINRRAFKRYNEMRLKKVRQCREAKRNKEELVLKQAIDLFSQNRELTFEEKEVLRKAEEVKTKPLKSTEFSSQYLEYLQKRKAEDTECEETRALRLKMGNIRRKQNDVTTPEGREAIKLKIIDRRKKRESEATPEELEAMKLKMRQQSKIAYEKRLATATPEERKLILERRRQLRQENQAKEESILKKAMDLPSQNGEMSLEEKEVLRKAEEIKAKRLKLVNYRKQYFQNRRAKATPKELEQMRLIDLARIRKCFNKKQLVLEKAMELLYRKNQELSFEENDIVKKAEEIKTQRMKVNEKRKQRYQNLKAEELEAMRLKRFEQKKKRQAKREKEDSILTQAIEVSKLNNDMSLEENDIVSKAEEIKAKRLKLLNYKNQYYQQRKAAAATSEKKEATTRYEQTKLWRMKNARRWLRQDQDYDEIKVEKEVLQETTIKAISVGPYLNPVAENQQEGYNDSSCSWLELSQNSFMTAKASKKHSYFQSFYGSSVKFDRRKLYLEEPFRCMRVLINSTTKLDGLASFGKQIAQKLRSSKKNVAEVNVAKQLIDDILQNLAVGGYGLESKVVKVEN